MIVTKTNIPGVVLLEPQIFGDSRGWFYEFFSEEGLREIGILGPFVQDNRSYSAQKGTLRGLHCQAAPRAQAKLFSCTRGAVFDVAVDVREGSPTFGQWAGFSLSADNKRQLYIPRGCLHGFVTLTDDVEVLYKVDEYYSKEHDRSVRFNDPFFGIDWGVKTPILSEKDRCAPLWSEAKIRF